MVSPEPRGTPEPAKWKGDPPASWLPLVTLGPGKPTVTFYTHTELGAAQIVRHTDTYVDGCRFQTKGKAIATGGRGYVF